MAAVKIGQKVHPAPSARGTEERKGTAFGAGRRENFQSGQFSFQQAAVASWFARQIRELAMENLPFRITQQAKEGRADYYAQDRSPADALTQKREGLAMLLGELESRISRICEMEGYEGEKNAQTEEMRKIFAATIRHYFNSPQPPIRASAQTLSPLQDVGDAIRELPNTNWNIEHIESACAQMDTRMRQLGATDIASAKIAENLVHGAKIFVL